MRFALTGDVSASIRAIEADIERRLQRAGQAATHIAGIGLHSSIRNAMRRTGLGGLSNVIKLQTDKQSGTVKLRGRGWSTGAFVYPKIDSPRTAGALESYLSGAEIVPRQGRYLAFATKEIPQRVGRRRMTPKLYETSGLSERIGPLRFMRGKGRVSYLIVENTTIGTDRQGKARKLLKSGKAGKGRANVSIVAFILIRATRRRARLDPRRISQDWASKLPALFRSELDKQPARQRLRTRR